MPGSIDLIAVLVTGIAGFVVGMLWHGPLFGKQWLKLSGISEREAREAYAKGGMGPIMAIAFVAQLVTAYILAMFIQAGNIQDFAGAAMLAFWLWLGFIATVLLNTVLWEKKPVNLYYFNITYHLVQLVVMATILAYWR